MPKITEKFESPKNLPAPTPGNPVTFGSWADADFPSLSASPLGMAHLYVEVDGGPLEGRVIALNAGDQALTSFVLNASARSVSFDYFVSSASIFPNPDAVHVTYRSDDYGVIGEKSISSALEDNVGTLDSEPGWNKPIKYIELRAGPGGSNFVTNFVMES